jgi:hypothetical protein
MRRRLKSLLKCLFLKGATQLYGGDVFDPTRWGLRGAESLFMRRVKVRSTSFFFFFLTELLQCPEAFALSTLHAPVVCWYSV